MNESNQSPAPVTEQPVVNTPYDAPKRYTNFYLTLLILSTISTTLGLFNLLSIPAAITQLNDYPLAGILTFAGCIVWLISIIALVLLYKKHPFGIKLKLATYVASVVISLLLLLTIPYTTEIAAEEAVKQADAGAQIDKQTVKTVATYFTGAAIAVTVASNIVFSLLWQKAWKQQVAADLEQKV